MADLRYTVDIDTKGAKSALSGLTSSILGIGASLGVAFGAREIVQIAARFEDLRTTLNFLFKEAGAGTKAFEQIKKFAAESVFSVEDLTNAVVKLKAAGLDPSIKQLTLFADVSSVATDSVGALQAITDLFARTTAGGLGLEDLNRLADRGIPVFNILKDKIGLSRLEVSEFGKSAEGAEILLQALTEGLEETFGGASAARANNLSQAFSNLGDAFSNTADEIGQAGLNETIGEAVRKFTELLEANRSTILAITQGLVGALVFLGENLKYISALLAGVFAAAVAGRIHAITVSVIAFTKAIRAASVAGAVLQGVTGVGLIKLAAGLAGAAAAIVTINELTEDGTSSIEDLDKSLENLKNNAETGPLTLPEAPNASGGFGEKLDLFKTKQDELARASIDYFKKYKDSVNDTKEKITQESKLLTMSEAQANVQRELNRFTSEYFSTIRPLQEKLTALKLKDTDEARSQTDEIQKQLASITELYNVSRTGLREELELREQIATQKERDELFLNTQLTLQENLNDLVRESQNNLEDLNLTAFEKELQDLNRQVDDKLVGSFDNLKRAWKNGLISADDYIAEMARLEKFADQAFAKIKENAGQQRDIQRSFAFGWKRAFESYTEDATNAAKGAEKIFKTTTQGIEDTIVGFVKTGKLEFKSLINDILEQLLRSQIQQVVAQTFGAFGGGGGGGGGLGDFFSGFFANGGMIPAGSFGVVGERGPELVSGPATVTPMGGGGAVTYNINAVDASSFKQMVARDPGFIHAVASQGARKVPARR
jgi:lambda family phage tail tape measure protein